MLPDRVSNSGPLTYESSALPIAPRGPATFFTQNTTSCGLLCNIYTMGCPPVRGDNSRAFANSLSPIEADEQ